MVTAMAGKAAVELRNNHSVEAETMAEVLVRMNSLWVLHRATVCTETDADGSHIAEGVPVDNDETLEGEALEVEVLEVEVLRPEDL